MALPAGLILAASSTGSGKTTLTLGLLRAFKRRGLVVAPAKVGPDYIDPAFHTRASGRICHNLDGWAMRPATLAGVIAKAAVDSRFILAEGVMGLFDGAPVVDGPDGSSADLAAHTGWPVLLVLDVARMGASAAALLHGFSTLRPDIRVAGVIFNRVGSQGHGEMVAKACRKACPEVAILGAIPRDEGLHLPSRHLGLVQALEQSGLEEVIERAANLVEKHVDLEAVQALATPGRLGGDFVPPLQPLGQRIAIAMDEAFAFAYPTLLEGWRHQGAQLSFFSPLAGEGPDETANAVYLPGGYPELHGPRLAASQGFLQGLRCAAQRSAWIYGECGGFMALGEAILDGEGRSHAMAGLLPLVTSFQARRLQLGYRTMRLKADSPLGRAKARFRGHEFHYATIVSEGKAPPLFDGWDARNAPLGAMGLIKNTVFGSFLHLIDET
ncbi:MAG: cobyrinate a,c-diamide synthase [Alphaproteobacteria bacterium]|nr:cobyrinate a,c-diamide synthase [Alphaproteobacteria bacterium]